MYNRTVALLLQLWGCGQRWGPHLRILRATAEFAKIMTLGHHFSSSEAGATRNRQPQYAVHCPVLYMTRVQHYHKLAKIISSATHSFI